MIDPNPAPASVRTLLLSTLAATAFAAVVLLTIVLPAEWGVDPNGVGRAIGLTRLAAPADAEFAGSTDGLERVSTSEGLGDFREDSVQIEIPARSSLEYKLRLTKGASFDYDWKTSRGTVFAELHGEPAGDKSGYYEDFNVSRAESVKGSLETRFDGSHGWYWKNENDFAVTITLTTRGVYEVIGKI
jgi:hypothetical protein